MNYNDYELIYQINDGDDIAYNILFSKYRNLIGKLAKYYYNQNQNIGIDYDDLYQVGMIALSNSLKDYDQNNTLFYTFFVLCARREMERLIKASRRLKHMLLNDSISINEPVKGSEDIYVEETVALDYNLEESYISDSNYLLLYNYKYNLKNEEALVYELRLNNFTIGEIANLLDISYKKVDNNLRKIRKLLREHILSLEQ